MERKIERYLPLLSKKEPCERREALFSVFENEHFSPSVQADEVKETETQTINYVFIPECSAPFPLFTAHYDAFPGSTGANDNAAALCIMIDLMHELNTRNITAGFAFLDGEEKGHTGAKLFVKNMRDKAFSIVVNLDMCGYGDLMTILLRGSKRKAAAAAFCSPALLKSHNAKMVKYLPEGDDCAFSARVQPVLSIAVMPKWDVAYLDALATYREGLIGKPPEFYQILGEMEIVTTMHGAFRDDIKWIQPEAMERVLSYLTDAVSNQKLYSNTTPFHFFGKTL